MRKKKMYINNIEKCRKEIFNTIICDESEGGLVPNLELSFLVAALDIVDPNTPSIVYTNILKRLK